MGNDALYHLQQLVVNGRRFRGQCRAVHPASSCSLLVRIAERPCPRLDPPEYFILLARQQEGVGDGPGQVRTEGRDAARVIIILQDGVHYPADGPSPVKAVENNSSAEEPRRCGRPLMLLAMTVVIQPWLTSTSVLTSVLIAGSSSSSLFDFSWRLLWASVNLATRASLTRRSSPLSSCRCTASAACSTRSGG